MIVIFLVYPFLKRGKFIIPINRNFKIITFFFVILILNSLLSYFLQFHGLIKFDNFKFSEIINRSLPHVIYIIFEYLIYLYLVIYLYSRKNHGKEIKYFIIYSFFFITFWGIYQWLTTFNIIPYLEVFNNSLSTKFTYLRFKHAHRTASVFPEPSEYAYFLAFIIPFAVNLYYKKESINIINNKIIFIFLLVLSIVLCRSMSLFIMLPLILFYLMRKYMTFRPIYIISALALFLLLLFGISILEYERFSGMIAGEDGSALTRYLAFQETMELFISSPLIGAGFGAVRGLDLLSFLLGTMGLIGFFFFFRMIFLLNAYTPYNKLFIQGLVCMLMVTLISNPILDLTFFWPILAFITVPLNVKE